MSLHYLVKLEMLNAHVRPSSCLLHKETPEFILPLLWPPNSPGNYIRNFIRIARVL